MTMTSLLCQVQGTLRLQLSVSLAPPHEAGLQLSLHLLAVFSLHLASLALARLDLTTLLSNLHTSGSSKILKAARNLWSLRTSIPISHLFTVLIILCLISTVS